ncbi:hypothetical protein ADICYQ_5919 [Cyclobacterium qasimii M12-11B]|uniref:Uncharacterized protein n=1 Tax=Cyclobacterium qasimii M12-11B TaxID=641524 RepID=S7WE44_9BACT|nr:hypothetical protein ADICYQ_5919 [Cyclobacterium qasimii M12-11B]
MWIDSITHTGNQGPRRAIHRKEKGVLLIFRKMVAGEKLAINNNVYPVTNFLSRNFLRHGGLIRKQSDQ